MKEAMSVGDQNGSNAMTYAQLWEDSGLWVKPHFSVPGMSESKALESISTIGQVFLDWSQIFHLNRYFKKYLAIAGGTVFAYRFTPKTRAPYLCLYC